MSYLLVLQLMAWHGSAGFTFMVDEKVTRSHTSVQQREACIFYYNKLSDEIYELLICKAKSGGRYWVCASHQISALGHDARIQRLRHRRVVINRKINRLGRETERSTSRMPC